MEFSGKVVISEMSLVTDSPVHSSSSDDFAAILDAELGSTSDTSPDREDEDGDEEYDSEVERIKRQKVDALESMNGLAGSTSHLNAEESSEASLKKDTCVHPGFIRGMCMICGQRVDDDTDVPKYGTTVQLNYIHKDLRLGNDEIVRLRNRDLKNLFRQKKLYLVLDLDHTLLNSTRLVDVTPEEEYLLGQTDSLEDVSKGSLFRLDYMHMFTKLRPYVRTFLKEVCDMFEMYIYTMGERSYALEMAKLLDPEKVYFSSRVIAQDDSTQRHQKGLDVVLGQESAVLILDDTEPLKSDESETDGALASILKVLKQIHRIFFDSEPGIDLADRDVREVLKTVRKEVLKGCKIVFSRVFPTKFQAENHHLWKMAEQLGAICVTETDPSVTHVVSADTGTEKSRWAVREKKFLVHPGWIEAANYFWEKQPEEKFPVK